MRIQISVVIIEIAREFSETYKVDRMKIKNYLDALNHVTVEDFRISLIKRDSKFSPYFTCVKPQIAVDTNRLLKRNNLDDITGIWWEQQRYSFKKKYTMS